MTENDLPSDVRIKCKAMQSSMVDFLLACKAHGFLARLDARIINPNEPPEKIGVFAYQTGSDPIPHHPLGEVKHPGMF